MILSVQTGIISFSSLNKLIYVMVKFRVYFAAQTELLNNI
jgi:hypothetical protein